MALGNADLRATFQVNLKNSPFRRHRLHLASYLTGVDGSSLAKSAATALGISRDAFFQLFGHVPDLEILMPNPYDRIKWDGVAPVLVMSSALNRKEQLGSATPSDVAFNGLGQRVRNPVFSQSDQFYVVILPLERPFPANPEALRAAARKKLQSTVSTAKEERDALRIRAREQLSLIPNGAPQSSRVTSSFAFATPPGGCTPESPPDCCDETMDECPPPPPESGGYLGGGGAVLPEGDTYYRCMGITEPLNGTNDLNKNGILDSCEFDIAYALRPLMNNPDPNVCGNHWPYWSISRHPDRPEHVQIFYALSYLEDCGGPWGSHLGDSEFVIVEGTSTSGSMWGGVYYTLSAHWEYGIFDATATYAAPDMVFPSGPNARVWVSILKHANYRLQSICDEGPNGSHYDDCPAPYLGQLPDIRANRNIGNYFHLPPDQRDLSTRFILDTYDGPPNPAHAENYWTGTEFAGWTNQRSGAATRYNKMLEFYGF